MADITRTASWPAVDQGEVKVVAASGDAAYLLIGRRNGKIKPVWLSAAEQPAAEKALHEFRMKGVKVTRKPAAKS